MKTIKRLSRFIGGFLAAILLVGLIIPAMAASGKNITVYTGVNLYIDDVKFNPKDANGNPVEAFIYNGTTYLPVRAISEAVGKNVQWDGKTSSVYLGKHSSNEPAEYLEDLHCFKGKDLYTKSMTDNMGQEHLRAISDSDFSNTYLINGQYSAITGTFFLPDTFKNERNESPLTIYGDGKVLYTAEVSTGTMPIDFSVDLTGVLELKIDVGAHYSMGHNIYGYLSNVNLWS